MTHEHGKYRHDHAWGTLFHSHLMRQICHSEECAGFDTHDIHRHLPLTLEGVEAEIEQIVRYYQERLEAANRIVDHNAEKADEWMARFQALAAEDAS